ncbi:flagellar assembly factor FliW [Halolactibacillus miurensis]|uniref:Flagellar assembly factor FliW n=1 Tax=Halolactibacillus miurensis TaxID=306541 RepID=A0A1I6TLZ3_9BACI|nr:MULTISPECIES: flagellar assembly protein FliW [Halolactibacillus]GEM04732.1 flagellar assembly factor FliW [Halolactibacillus miurensis]SFS90184.1 flagellar assembly factor FliW [Halolactibacillus miurensis]
MKINTSYFEEVEIDSKEVIYFEQGLPGFLNEKEFVLLSFDEPLAFQVLQSINTGELAFIVVFPFDFNKEYKVDLNDQILEQLKIETEDDVLILSIVTLKDHLNNSTANLQAPIIINRHSHLGKQYIMHQSNYSTKEYIFNSSIVKEEK